VHGALGVSDDTPLAVMWRQLRMLRLADGPDEVHKVSIARRELNRWRADDQSTNGKPAATTAQTAST
jgi:acyl-CoA dehydrogenase